MEVQDCDSNRWKKIIKKKILILERCAVTKEGAKSAFKAATKIKSQVSRQLEFCCQHNRSLAFSVQKLSISIMRLISSILEKLNSYQVVAIEPDTFFEEPSFQHTLFWRVQNHLSLDLDVSSPNDDLFHSPFDSPSISYLIEYFTLLIDIESDGYIKNEEKNFLVDLLVENLKSKIQSSFHLSFELSTASLFQSKCYLCKADFYICPHCQKKIIKLNEKIWIKKFGNFLLEKHLQYLHCAASVHLNKLKISNLDHLDSDVAHNKIIYMRKNLVLLRQRNAAKSSKLNSLYQKLASIESNIDICHDNNSHKQDKLIKIQYEHDLLQIRFDDLNHLVSRRKQEILLKFNNLINIVPIFDDIFPSNGLQKEFQTNQFTNSSHQISPSSRQSFSIFSPINYLFKSRTQLNCAETPSIRGNSVSDDNSPPFLFPEIASQSNLSRLSTRPSFWYFFHHKYSAHSSLISPISRDYVSSLILLLRVIHCLSVWWKCQLPHKISCVPNPSIEISNFQDLNDKNQTSNTKFLSRVAATNRFNDQSKSPFRHSISDASMSNISNLEYSQILSPLPLNLLNSDAFSLDYQNEMTMQQRRFIEFPEGNRKKLDNPLCRKIWTMLAENVFELCRSLRNIPDSHPLKPENWLNLLMLTLVSSSSDDLVERATLFFCDSPPNLESKENIVRLTRANTVHSVGLTRCSNRMERCPSPRLNAGTNDQINTFTFETNIEATDETRSTPNIGTYQRGTTHARIMSTPKLTCPSGAQKSKSILKIAESSSRDLIISIYEQQAEHMVGECPGNDLTPTTSPGGSSTPSRSNTPPFHTTESPQGIDDHDWIDFLN